MRRGIQPQELQNRPRRETFDNSTQFENYFETFSSPVKEVLKLHLDNKLNRERRPTIDDLQQSGILPIHQKRMSTRIESIDNYSIANPATKQRTSEKLHQHLLFNIQPKDIENLGIVPEGYFANTESTIAQQKILRNKIAQNLSKKLKTRPNIDGYQTATVHTPDDTLDGSRRHLVRWINSRRRTIEDLSSKGVLRSYFQPKNASYAHQSLSLLNNSSTIPSTSTNTKKRSNRPAHYSISHNMLQPSNATHNRRLSSSAKHQIAQSMESHISTISIGDLNDSLNNYEDTELLEHDLYHMLAHQIIPKSQQSFFQKLFREANNEVQRKKKRRPSQLHSQILHSTRSSIHKRNSFLKSKTSPMNDETERPTNIAVNVDMFASTGNTWTPMTEISMYTSSLKNRNNAHVGGQLSIMNLMDDQRKNTLQRGTVFAYSPQTTEPSVDGMNIIGYLPNISSNHEDNNNNSRSGMNDNLELSQITSKPPISYYSMPEYIDGGIVSCGVFLPYKYYCESHILHLTEQAGQCLDRMKKESQKLEHLHRQRVSQSPMHDLYANCSPFTSGGGGLLMTDDLYGSEDDMYGSSTERSEVQKVNDIRLQSSRSIHLQKLSEIDDNLADVRDQIQKMFTVQSHVHNIRQQFDTHTDALRQDQHELLNILKELQERLNTCQLILNNIRLSNIWIITNIANTIADRSEKCDRMSKAIRKCENDADFNSFNKELLITKTFINDLHVLINNLQMISDRKSTEISNLENNIKLLIEQNRNMIKSAYNSNEVVIDRLLELQNHYKLPTMMENEMDNDGRCDATLYALSFYCMKANTNDYYSRSLELYHSTVIYSHENLKTFFNILVISLNAVLIDCMLIHEYIETNVDVVFSDLESNIISSSSSSSSTSHVSILPMKYSISISNDDENKSDVHQSTDTKITPANSNSLLLLPTTATATVMVDRLSSESQTKRTDWILDKALNPIQLQPRTHSTLRTKFDKKFEHKNRRQLLSMIIDLDNIIISNNDSTVDDDGKCDERNVKKVQNENIKNMKFEGIEILREVQTCDLILHSNVNREKNYTKIQLDLMERIQIISNFARLLPYRETVISCVAQFITISFKDEIEECLKEKIGDFAKMYCKSILARLLFTVGDVEFGLIANIKTLILEGRLLMNERSSTKSHSCNNSGSSFGGSESGSNYVSNLNVYRMASLIFYNTYHLISPCPI